MRDSGPESGPRGIGPPRPGAGSIDRLVGAALLVLALAVGLEATTFDVVFLTDPVGPKALPVVVAVMLAVGGLRSLLRPRQEHQALPGHSVFPRIAVAVVAFLAYAATLPWLGFFLSTTGVVTGLAVLFGGPWKGGAITGLGLSAALWLLFVALLSLPLPVGELWIR